MNAKVPKNSSTATEAMILRSVLEYLQAKHILAFRMNTGAVSLQSANGKQRFMRFGTPGMADVMAFPVFTHKILCSAFLDKWHESPAVIPLWIECKSPIGVQSELQKSFQAQVEAQGHVYIIARNVDDVEDALK